MDAAADPTLAGDADRLARAHGSRTVRAWLARLVLACTLPAALLAATYIAYDFHASRERLLHDTLLTARALNAVVDQKLAGHVSALQALAGSTELQRGDLQRFAEQAARLVERLDANNVVLVDRQLRQVVNTLRPYGSPLPASPNTAWRKVFDTGEPVVTDLFFGPVAMRPLMAVGVPVRHDGTVMYTLAAGLWTERLSGVLLRQRLPAAWVATIYDSTGHVVARTRDIERFAGRKGPPALLNQMSRAAEGVLENETLEGMPVYSAFSRSTATGWTVAIGIPRASLAQPLYGNLLGLAVVTAGVLAFAWAAARRVGALIGTSMHSLVEPAHSLGRGEPVSVPPSLVSEANEIADALNRASALLQQSLDRAHHDPLTGLANRSFFEEFAQHELAVSRRRQRPVAILYLDLDGFKQVNDRLGHAAGDQLLVRVAEQLCGALRQSDLLARLGGDEFAAVLLDTDADDAALVAAKLLSAVVGPARLDGQVPLVSASIGVAVFPQDGHTLRELLHKADSAMYDAKARGKARVSLAASGD